MKTINLSILILVALLFHSCASQGQWLNKVKDQANQAADQLKNTSETKSITEGEAAQALRDALDNGAKNSVNVVSVEEIAKRGFTFVGEALQLVPGISISQTGAFGGTTTLSIRGAPSSQTLVLIDGISVNDPSSPGGGYDFSNLLTSNIESIEILKSSQSTLWGSDAIGGIINIITKVGLRPPP